MANKIIEFEGRKYSFPEGTTDTEIQSILEEPPKGEEKHEPTTGDYVRSVFQGLTFGFSDEAEAAAKALFGEETYRDEVNKIRQEIESFRAEDPVAAYGLEAAGSLPTMFIPGVGAARGLQGLSKLSAAKQAAITGAAGGALYGAGTAETIEDIPESALAGAAVGGTLAGGLSKVFPAASAAAKTLIKEGVPLTPGQALGGASRVAEEALSAFPITRDIITGAKETAVRGFGRASINRLLAPVGEKLGKSSFGTEAFDEAFSIVSSKYENIIPKLSINKSEDMISAIKSAVAEASDEYVLTSGTRKNLDDIIKTIISDIPESGIAKGELLKRVESKLGNVASQRIKSAGADDKAIGLSLFDIQSAFRKELSRQNPKGKELQKLNTAFKNLIPVQNAVNKAIASGGEFTPKQMLQSIKQQSQRKAARGKADMQEFVTAAEEIMSPSSTGAFAAPLTGAAMAAELMSGNISPIAKGIATAVGTAPLYSEALLPVARGALAAPGYAGRFLAPISGGILSQPVANATSSLLED